MPARVRKMNTSRKLLRQTKLQCVLLAVFRERQWWNKAVTVTLLEWWKAKTTTQALRPVERCSKLKTVLVRSHSAGKRKNRGTLAKWQMNMERWIDGDWEMVWKEACNLGNRRSSRRGRSFKKRLIKKPWAELMKRLMRVKRLVNDGELLKRYWWGRCGWTNRKSCCWVSGKLPQAKRGCVAKNSHWTEGVKSKSNQDKGHKIDNARSSS